VITIITSIRGSYDHPKQFVPQSIPCRMLLVTDAIQHPSCAWETAFETVDMDRPRLAAKRPKLFPARYSSDGPWIWIDGRMEIISPTFAEEALDSVETIGMWRHPARDCAYQEAAFSSTLPKYRGQPLAEQADYYLGEGLPRHGGLWAAGLIVYKHETQRLCNTWMDEINRWGVQDQVSLAYASWVTGEKIEPLPHHLLENPWLFLHAHLDGTG
jgi:hypothetical protein